MSESRADNRAGRHKIAHTRPGIRLSTLMLQAADREAVCLASVSFDQAVNVMDEGALTAAETETSSISSEGLVACSAVRNHSPMSGKLRPETIHLT